VSVLRVGTRGSELAMAQTGQVADALRASGCEVELVPVRTAGDRSKASLVDLAGALGGTGIFVSALRARLADGSIDVAVHSLKDLPVAPADGLTLAAVPRRADPADVLVSAHPGGFAGLPPGATVGTGSPRRAAQLLLERSDLSVVPIRGNVGTRLNLVGRSVDAVVLAAAGLLRSGRAEVLAEASRLTFMLPAPGQGALAVETRTDAVDGPWWPHLQALDERDTRACVCAERALLGTLEAGCTAPVGALATIGANDGALHLDGAVLAADGTTAVRGAVDGSVDDAEAIGAELGHRLLSAGAADLLSARLDQHESAQHEQHSHQPEDRVRSR